jgi:uncharacterized membrane protein
MFKMVNDKIDDVKSPFFVNPPRNENEWYSYIDNAERLISYIKSWDIEVNEPKEQEWAQWLDFDVLTVTDSWLLVFLNKKNWTTTKEELSTYVDWIKEMIKQFRVKLKI